MRRWIWAACLGVACSEEPPKQLEFRVDVLVLAPQGTSLSGAKLVIDGWRTMGIDKGRLELVVPGRPGQRVSFVLQPPEDLEIVGPTRREHVLTLDGQKQPAPGQIDFEVRAREATVTVAVLTSCEGQPVELDGKRIGQTGVGNYFDQRIPLLPPRTITVRAAPFQKCGAVELMFDLAEAQANDILRVEDVDHDNEPLPEGDPEPDLLQQQKLAFQAKEDERRIAAEAEKQRKAEEARLERERIAAEKAERLAEEKRQKAEAAARAAEEKRAREEEARLAKERQRAEAAAQAARLAEERKEKAEAARREKERQAEEAARLAEEKRQKAAVLAASKAEAERQKAEAAAAEKQRLAEERQKREQLAAAEKQRKAEEAARLAEEKREKERLAAAERQRKAEEAARLAEEKRQKAEAAAASKAEADRQKAEAAAAEKQRKAEEAARLVEEKRQKEEEARLAKEAKAAEQKALLEAQKKGLRVVSVSCTPAGLSLAVDGQVASEACGADTKIELAPGPRRLSLSGLVGGQKCELSQFYDMPAKGTPPPLKLAARCGATCIERARSAGSQAKLPADVLSCLEDIDSGQREYVEAGLFIVRHLLDAKKAGEAEARLAELVQTRAGGKSAEVRLRYADVLARQRKFDLALRQIEEAERYWADIGDRNVRTKVALDIQLLKASVLEQLFYAKQEPARYKQAIAAYDGVIARATSNGDTKVAAEARQRRERLAQQQLEE